MQPHEKIEKLFEALTRRFGVYPLKEGQELATIKRTWALSVGRYPMASMFTAVTSYTAEAKYNTWPTEGEMLDILKMISLPESDKGGVKDRYDEAVGTFDVFYRGLLDNPTVNGERVGFNEVDAVLRKILRSDWPENRGKRWRQLAAEAVMRRDLPEKWDELATAVMAQHKRAFEGYIQYRVQYGTRAANENYNYGG